MTPAVIWASGALSVIPDTNLSNGQVITVSGSGFTAKSTGSILECNSDPSQPTIAFFGNPISVSCSKPLSALVTTDSSGNLPSTSFTIVTGTVGPPATGTDSSGGNATTDAANYPCPPTQAQVAMGYTCDINFGDAANDIAIQNLAFTTAYTGSSGTPTPIPSPAPVSSAGSTTTSNKSTSAATKPSPSTSPSSSAPTTSPTAQSSTISQDSSQVSITSTVSLTIAVDTSHAKPIPGAKVTLDNTKSLATDSNGLVTFQSVSTGSHTITVNDPGKKLTKVQLTLASGQDNLVSIEFASNKSDTLYYILAGAIVLLLGCGYTYWKLHHRPPKISNSLIPAAMVNNSSTPIAQEPPINLPVQQVGQVISPDEKSL